jgi:hypothetical protein
MFHLDGHTAVAPRSLSVTRILPTPRKGNPGTCKTFLNLRLTTDISHTEGVEKLVPTIIKIETSCPVGSDMDPLRLAFVQLANILKPTGPGDHSAAQRDLFLRGYLLDNSGVEISSENG